MQMNKLIIYVTCDASECCACSICMFLPSWKRDNFSEQIQDKIWIDLCTCRQGCSWYEILVWCNANYPRNKKHNKDLLNPRIILFCLTILEEYTSTLGQCSAGSPNQLYGKCHISQHHICYLSWSFSLTNSSLIRCSGVPPTAEFFFSPRPMLLPCPPLLPSRG